MEAMARFKEAGDRLVDADTAVRRAQMNRLVAVADMLDAYPAPAPLGNPAAERVVPAGAEGAGDVGEYVALEVGVRLAMSEPAAWTLVHDVANLRARHPRLWEALGQLQVEDWQARAVAQACGELSAEAARWVDEKLASAWGTAPWPRIRRRMNGLIVAADAELARRRAETARRDRFVSIRHLGDSTSLLTARIDTAAALTLGSTLAAIVDQLIQEGVEEPLPMLRARALEIVATRRSPESAGAAQSSQAAPVADVVVHIAAEALGPDAAGTEVARVTGRGGDVGPMLADQLAHLLGHHRIRMLPLIDLAGDPAVDAYEIPTRMSRQMLMREDCSVFPFSSARARSSDLDHTIPYRRSTPGSPAPPGQTRISNLGPLGRREHRAKTAGLWKLGQPEPGVYEWTSRTGDRWRVTRGGTARIPDRVQRTDLIFRRDVMV